jgi:UPF0176 protein
MALLHNRVSQAQLKQQLLAETEPRTTISFYQYFNIPNPQQFRDELYQSLQALQVFGRIYVAPEGINAQISVPTNNYQQLQNVLYSYPPLNNIRLNIAVDDDGKSFWVLKIKVRQKIVADGITDPTFSMQNKGKYVNAQQINQMLQNPNTIVVDMRNHYEYEVGHFTNAIEIPSDTFRDQLPMAVEMLQGSKDKNIVMYCTGGIRCEKASAYMLHAGFNNVYHLEGGIINYAQQIKAQNLPSQFIGKNFVFDNRLGERITPDVIAQCHQCHQPADTHTNCANSACHLLFIQCQTCATTYSGCCSQACANVYTLPPQQQKQLRQGITQGRKVFNKSKSRLSNLGQNNTNNQAS